jgi:hypothetical protein
MYIILTKIDIHILFMSYKILIKINNVKTISLKYTYQLSTKIIIHYGNDDIGKVMYKSLPVVKR